MSYKNWIFTLNNYTEDTESLMQVSHPEVVYMVYGHEIGESGTPHLQGYFELDKKRTLNSVKKIFGVLTLHLENRRGTQEDAINYAIKDGNDIYERGEKAKSTGRPTADKTKNKVLQFKSEVKAGLNSFADHPEASFHLLKHAQLYMSLTESPRSRTVAPFVSWYYGPTGTGKTLRAFKEATDKGLEPYVKSGNGKWFDGYDGHTFVIFDDFRDSHIEFGFLLRLLDRYPLRVELKGSSRQWKATRIVITSPLPPKECYMHMQATDKYDRIEQLLRRINEVVEINSFDENLLTEKEDPQTPQGGLKRIDINTPDLITPPRVLFPVVPRSPPVLRQKARFLEDFVCPHPTQSPTQIWNHPDSD